MKESFIETIACHIRSGCPCLSINTDETIRVTNEIRRAAWKVSDGTKIRTSPSKLGTYERIFKKHLKDDAPSLQKDKSGPYLVFDSNKFYTCLLRIEQAMGKTKENGDIEKLTDDSNTIDELLNSNYQVVTWNIIDGFSTSKDHKGSEGMEEALEFIDPKQKADFLPANCIIVMRDCHPYFNLENNPRYRGRLRNMVENNLLTTVDNSRHIILVQPDWTPHRDIQSCISVVDFPLPNEDHLDHNITYIENSIDNPELRVCAPELRTDLCRLMRGFTETEAINALSYCVAKHGGFKPDMTKTIQKLQMAAFSKTGVLTMVDEDTIDSTDNIGGFENYLSFVDECMLCFSPEAKKLKLAKPKGCLILGVPGVGKSVVAKATAKRMHLPLLIYDFGAQFGSLVGQTEATQRQVLKQINAKGPCVLLLDEADKVFAGTVGGFQGDSGVNMRAFGRLLSWMANENDEAFVLMTMNRTIGIPPELLRAGRLDAIFYATFPTPRERLDILGIHMKKNGANPELIEKKQWEQLVKETDQYVGAELECLVKKAIRTAFKNRKTLDPTFEELVEAKKVITPVIKLDEANIKAIKEFCEKTATPVSTDDAESKVFKGITLSRNIRINPSDN